MNGSNCYTNLRDFLADYIEEFNSSAKKLAGDIQAPYNTVRRWTKERAHPNDEYLIRLSKTQAMPFELLVRLRSEIPTWYNFVTRRMTYSPFERDFVNRRVIQRELFRTGGRTDTSVKIQYASTSLKTVLLHKRHIYTDKLWASHEVVAQAAELAAPLNLVAYGPKGTYAGHVLTLPIKSGTYLRMQEGLHESQITTKQLEPLESDGLGALHIYSFYACTSHTAYVLLQQMVLELLRRWDRLVARQCYLSRYPVTEDGIELADKLGLVSRSRNPGEHASTAFNEATEVIPEFWDAQFGGKERQLWGGHKGLDWIMEYRGEVRV